jgi:hypothetical protein
MRNVKKGEFEPGLVLSRDVEDAEGYKLLRKGTVLTDAHVALLESWKVLEIWTEEQKAAKPAPEKAKEAEPPRSGGNAILEAAKLRLRARFEGSLVNPWMTALCNEAEKRLATPRFWR